MALHTATQNNQKERKMNQLFTQNAAIKYLREQTGKMSLKVFLEEVKQGRIPEKPYGKTVRFRKEDLDKWQTITQIHHSDYSDVVKSTTHISRSLQMDEGLSFANLLAKAKSPMRKIGA